MSEQLNEDEKKVFKSEFLKSYREVKTVKKAAESVGLTRARVENWRRVDNDFRLECEAVEADILDEIKDIAFQQMGVLPCKLKNRKWINNNLIVSFLKRDQTNINVNNNVVPLEVKGLDSSVLLGLSAPETGERKDGADEDTVKEMVGVPRKRIGVTHTDKDLPVQ